MKKLMTVILVAIALFAFAWGRIVQCYVYIATRDSPVDMIVYTNGSVLYCESLFDAMYYEINAVSMLTWEHPEPVRLDQEYGNLVLKLPSLDRIFISNTEYVDEEFLDIIKTRNIDIIDD